MKGARTHGRIQDDRDRRHLRRELRRRNAHRSGARRQDHPQRRLVRGEGAARPGQGQQGLRIPGQARHRLPTRRLMTFWRVLAVVTALRVWVAARLPLTIDEPYYWLWGHHPAAGYYDHPPLAAWA